MKKYFLELIFNCFCLCSIAQQAIVQGYVFQEESRQPLAFATVSVLETQMGTITDSMGFFALQIEPGLYNLEASFLGYHALIQHEILATTGKPIYLELRLKKQHKELTTVEVSAKAFQRTAETPLSLHSVNVNEIERMPGATLDVSKFIRTLPGVSPRTSFGYNLIVRGGASLENRFYLDGIEIPSITHFNVQGTSGGPNGLLNTRLLTGAELYSGAFPANKPNALSSVLEITQREGRKDRFGGNFTLGATDWGFVLEGPMGKKSSYMFSARESFSQHMLKAFGVPVLPFYADVNYKQKIRFNNKNELTILGLGAYDKYTLNLEAEATEALLYNTGYIPEGKQFLYTIGANYKHYLDNNSVYQFVLSRNYFYNQAEKYHNNSYETTDQTLDYLSKETENKLRLEHHFYRPKMEYAYGISLEHDLLQTDNYSFYTFPSGQLDTFQYNSQLQILRYGGFFSWSKKYLNGKLDVFAGLRFDGNTYNAEMNKPLKQFSPRLALSYQLAPQWRASMSMGIYYQLPPYLLLVFQEAEALVNKEKLSYMRSAQIVGGLEHTTTNGYRFQLEGFYKGYGHYPFLLYDSISLANANAAYVLLGNQAANSDSRGESFGLEVSIRQKFHKSWFWNLSYSYIVSRFEDTKGNLVASSWDNRHSGTIAGGKTLKGNWQIGLRWSFSGGNPYTPYNIELSSRQEIWDSNRRGLFDYTQLNQARLPVFHQLDFRVDKRFNFRKWTMSIYMDIQNAYSSPIALLPYLTVERDENAQPILDPNDRSRYLVKIISSDTGRVLPTLGVILDF